MHGTIPNTIAAFVCYSLHRLFSLAGLKAQLDAGVLFEIVDSEQFYNLSTCLAYFRALADPQETTLMRDMCPTERTAQDTTITDLVMKTMSTSIILSTLLPGAGSSPGSHEAEGSNWDLSTNENHR